MDPKDISVKREAATLVFYCHDRSCGGRRLGDIVGAISHLMDHHKMSVKGGKEILDEATARAARKHHKNPEE